MTDRKLMFVSTAELRVLVESAWRDGNGSIEGQPVEFVAGRVEALMDEAMRRLVESSDDPLGYDTSDENAAIRQMAADALSGKNKEAVQAELDRVRRRWKP